MEEEDDGDDDDVVDAAATAEADVPMGWGLRTNAHAPFQLERRTILCALRGHAIGIRPNK